MGNQIVTVPYQNEAGQTAAFGEKQPNEKCPHAAKAAAAESTNNSNNTQHYHLNPHHQASSNTSHSNIKHALASMSSSNAADIPPECPMHAEHKSKSANSTSPIAKNDNSLSSTYKTASVALSSSGECPIKHENDINPTNMMYPPNQQPSPNQPFPLSTNRVVSNIPKAGTENDKWQYPSEQMFWNAMLRKGWRWEEDAVKKDDMSAIIHIHNANNEKAWNEVMMWESMHFAECQEPKLKKFGGKASDFSPRARIRNWMGYELPFDRHDWIVDRCGKEVRYIIDYYDGGPVKPNGEFTLLDVRPALDSFGALNDRVKAAYMRWTEKNNSEKK